MDYDLLIGMNKKDAIDYLAANGVQFRIAHEDGRDYALAAEYRPGSIIISIVDGKISSIHSG